MRKGLLAGAVLLALAGYAYAQSNTLCAVVKLQILQTATFEREAFDAQLIVSNNLPTTPFTDLKVQITIKNSNGEPVDNLFFVKVTTLTGTNAVDGTGVVQSSSTAQINWLIIPSSGTGGVNPAGQRYAVKAAITGMSGTDPQGVTTFDEYITVHPQPVLRLEYVLPYEVFGDEPLTAPIEGIEPFPLGVRVTNIGYGTATDFKIDSAQPKILENKLNLPIDFKLLGSVVSGKTIPNTLLIPFGDIGPTGVGQASWLMSTTLSGRFIEFKSTFTHAASLGGDLTSLIQDIRTYTLLHDVLVDLPGRDRVPDFLVNSSVDRNTMQSLLDTGEQAPAELLLESDQPEPLPVVEVPADLTGTLGGTDAGLSFVFTAPVSSNVWVHSSVPFPYGKGANITSARRADGKVINLGNVWISKHFRKGDLKTLYRLNLLDLTGQTTAYVVQFSPLGLDQPPSPVTDLAAATGPDAGSLSLSWTAPGEDQTFGGITGGRYIVEASFSSTTVFTPLAAQVNVATSTLPGNAENLLVRNLVGNATTYIRLWTQDTGGNVSEMSNGATAYTLPYPPKDIVFDAITTTSIFASWQIGNNRLPIGYRVSASSAPGGSTLSSSPVQDSFTRAFVFGGLSPNSTIYFTGIGLNTETEVASAASIIGSTVTYAEAPSSGSLVALSPSSVTASWGLAGNPADTEFYAELSTSPDHAPVARASGWIRATTAVFGDLAQQTPYYGRVKARNRTGIETDYVDLGGLTTPSDVFVAASADGIGTLSSNRPDETITAVSTDSRALAMGAAAAQNLALVGSLYELEPSPVLFDPPATLSLTVDPDGRAPATISLYRFNGVAWDSAPVTSQQYAVDAATAVRFSGRLSGASLYGAFAGATPTGADITSVDFVRGVGVAASAETVAVDAATGEFFVNVSAAVKKYDATGNLLTTFGTTGTGAGQFGSIRGMRLGPDGRLYIADSSNHVVHVYTTAGTFVSDLSGLFTAPQDLFFDTGDKLNVLDMSLSGVYRLELGGAFISSIAVTGTSPFGGLAMSPQDDYYVSNYTQRRVYKYSQAGALLATLGDGTGKAAFNRPRYLDVDADGRAHVADWFGNRIAVFSSTGGYIGEYGTPETTPQGAGINPLGVAVVKATGRVYVAEQATQAVFEYALNTTPIPAPLIVSPAQGKTVRAAAPLIVGRGRSGLKVELLDGGVLIASTTVSDPRGFFLLSPALAAGPHSLSARASSAFGAVSPVGPAIAFTAAAAPAPFRFGAPVYKPAPIPPYADMSARASATGDFNGDGHADLLLLGELGYSAFAGDGLGGFTALPPVAAPTPGGFGHFARALATDLNQDGKLDAVAAVNEGDVRVLPGNGDGTFGTMIVLAPDYTRFYIPDLAVTDATGDGRPDIVAATCDSLQVLSGQGGFSFANGPVIPVSTGPFVSDCRLRLEDFNRDARPDAVVGGSVLLGAAGGAFGPAATVCANCNLAAAGDFNDDGNPDLAVALFAVGLRTYLGLGQGEFVALSTQAAIPMGRGYEGTGPTPDLNLDGLADLAVGRDGAVDLLASRGDGTFGPAYAVALGSACVSVQTLSYGDLREDAAPDLATAMNYSACSVDEAAILLNEARSPAPVVDLAAVPGAVDGETVLSWTNTGDDGPSGDLLGAQFVVRYSTGQISDASSVAPSSGSVTVSTNAPAGSAQTLTIGGLYPGTTWYFAVTIVDAAGHASLWSRAGGANALNSAPARDLPPGAPSSARVTATSSATVALAWDAPPAPAYDDLASYKVYRATYPFSGAGEPNVTLAASVAVPQTSVEIGGLYPDATSYWAVAAADLGDLGGGLFSVPLEGALSNTASTRTAPAYVPSTPPNPLDTRDVRFAFTIGGNGSAPGLFDNVMDVAVDPDGFVYASDQMNSRVQKLTPEGQFVLAWGEPGTGPGQFGAGRAPAGLSACPAPFSGVLVAADELNARVQIFTSTGGFLGQIGPVIGSTTLLRPRGAACDASGNVYVADHDLDRIFKTDMAGNQLASWPLPPFSVPAVDEPVWHLAVDAGGFVYASGGPQVLKFTPDGALVRSFGAGYGTNPGQFTGTKGIAFDAFGNLYATDSCRTTRCVQIFEPTGDFAVNFSSPGSGPGQLTQNYPFGVAVHRPTGRIYVADTFNDRIEVFTVEPSTAVSPAPACGAHVFGLVTLDQDLVCAGDGLTAAASGTTIDCAGRSITFATGTAGVGVRVAGLSGVTVRNCVLVAGSTTALASPSAYLSVPAVAGADSLENTSFASSSSTVKILGPAAIISTVAVTGENFELAFNAVRLSTALADLNTASEVSLHRLTFSTPVARWDPDGGGVQTDCPETICAPLSYAGGTFTFRAPGLGSFFSREGGTFTATSGEGTLVSNRADETIAAVSAPSQTAAFAAAADQGLTLMTLSYYELQPSPVVFDPAALLSFTFDPAAVDTNTIAIYRYNGPEWSSAPVAGQTLELLGPSLARVSGYLSSASLYAVFRTPAAPALTLSSIAPSSATTGTSIATALVGTGFDASAALSLERLAIAQGTWTATGSFTRGRYHGTLTKLRDGRVLLAGGRDPAVNGSYLTNADLYDPATGSWTAAPPMKQGRVLHASALMADGRVMVAGGSAWPYNSVEIFDPVLSTWTAAPPLTQGQSMIGAALLPDGRVLAVSGWDGGSLMGKVEIYDPVADTWSPAPALSTARRFAKMTTLSDGKILVSGGTGVATAEVYDPVTNAWTPAGTMSHARELHQIALLPGGKVLATGGWGPVGASSTTDVYDPATNAWTATAPMGGPRGEHAMVLVNGTPLVIGGRNASADLASTELYDAATNTWQAGPTLLGARLVPNAATLADGRVLVAAGTRTDGGLNTAELLNMPSTRILATGVAVADGEHLSGSLDLTGAATGYWDVVVRESGDRIGRLDAGFRVLSDAPVLASIAVAPSTATIAAGTTAQFDAAGTFTDGSTRTLTAGEISWTTDVSSVATVDANGLATGVSSGAARVTASSGAVSGFADLIVNATSFVAASGDGAATLASSRGDETITAVSTESVAAAYGAAGSQGLVLMTPSLYELQPSPVVFDPAALLSFTFDPAAVDTNTIAIYRYNGPEWSSAPVAGQTLELLGPSLARISGYLSSASLYAVFRTSAAPAAGLAWSQLSPAPDPVHGAPSPRVFNSTVYNPESKRLIVFAGAGAGGYGVLDDVWVLSGADGAGGAPAWTKLAPDAPSGAPGARDAHVAVYDQANNRMIIHGGYNSPGNCGGVVSDAWVLTNADGTGGTPAWLPLSPAGTAPARRYHRAAYDAANNRLIINGGAPSGCGAGGNDTWVLTNANGLGGMPVWTQLAPAAPANFPADSSGGSAGYDPASNRFLRLHHIDGSIKAWALSNGNGLGGAPAWSEVDGGTRPAVLDWVGPGGAYDPGTNAFVFFGAGSAASNETWTLSGANGVGASQWTKLEPAGQPDARVWASLVYAPGSDRATMFGGSKNSWDGTGEVWTLANALGAPAALTAISVAPSSGTIDAGSTLQLAAAGTFSNGLTRGLIASDGVAWSVDAGTVASVDASGLVTGASAGAARVTASSGAVSGFADLIVNATYFVAASGDGAATLASSRGDETITAVSTGSVAAAYAAAVSSQGLVLMTPSLYELSPSPVVFDPPATLTLRFDPVGVDTATVSIYRFNGVAWDSAPVAGQQIVAIGGGLFEISGILQSASLYAAFSLPVPAPALASITVTPSTASVLAGTTAQFAAAGTFTDGSTRTVTGEVAWTTDVSSVATVTASGLASGAAAGTARVIASSGAVSGYATLTVTVPPPPALTVASIAPSSAATGSSVAAALTGAGFDASAALSLERTSVAQGTWTAAEAFTQDRMMGTMTKLRDGRALLAGGTNDGSTAFADVDLYDPATGSWTAAPPLNQGRNQHAAVLLADGRVLVAGGYAGGFINSTEIYDPALNAWATAAPMASGRVGHQLALLADGRVLAAGGWNGASELSGAEIYDPAADSWSPAAPMSEGRVYPSMTLMNNGKALVAGGSSSATAEVYDPAANTWTAAGTLSAARQNLRSVVLPDGKVLATGGTGPAGTSNAADVYDPATNGWTATAPMGVARLGHAMVSASGTPLVIGGENPSTNLASTEIYDAATNAWLPGPSLSGSRTWLHALALDDGRVLAAGGRRDGTTLNTAEALGAAAVSIAATGVTVTDAQHLTGTLELIGAATGYWDVVVRESGGRVGRLDGGFRVLAGAPVLASIAVTPSMASIPVGATAQFEAAGTFTDGSTRTLTGEVVWSTDVSSVATVNAGGLAAGAAAGRARIVASSGPITSYATLTVTFPALTVVSIAPSSATTGTSVAAVLVGTGFDTSAVLTLERSDVLRGTWTATGSFAQGRYYSTLTKLSDGRALLAGGLLEGTAAGVAAVDLYDPATGAWTSGPALNMGRRQHEAVRLADGRVLVAGGNGPTGAIINTAEIYDPALSAWTAAPPMGSVRTGHRLALLSDGRVLAAGGWNGASELSSAEIYDPAADSWSPAAPMSEGRVYPSMTLMNNGKALVAGGSSSATAEVYDPASNTWTAAGTLSAARQNLRSVVLPGGKVLATGGTGSAGTSNAADVYDPATNAWAATGPMGVPRYAHAMVLVNGTPLVVGGENTSSNLATTESYDATANAWLPGPSLLATRSWLQAVVLDDGRVLAAGGRRILGGATHLNTAEVLGGEGGQIVATGVTAADAEHLSGALDLTGAATGYWDVVVRESGGRVGRLNGGFRVLPGAPVLASIAVTPSTASVLAGTTAQFEAAGTFTDGSTRTVTGEVAWTTDVSSVATVGASGLATGVAAGTARVIASSGAVSGHATLTVTPAPVTLASIAVTPAAASVPAGGTAQFAAVGVLTDGSTVAFASSDGTWQSQAAMNAARLGAPGEFAGGKFFVFGGFNGTGLTSTEAYDPLTNVWTFRAAQPVNRSYSQAAEAGGKIYVVGGCINADCGAVTNALWMYDPAADTWTQKASIPTARFHFSFENIGGKLYAAGGYLPGFSLSTALEVYDPATNAWTARAPLPQARAMSAAGEIGGKLYMSGGTTGATTADLRIYDPAVNSWTAGAPQPLARLAQSGAVLNGRLYAFGDGGGSEATARRVFVYDAAANAWSEGAGLSVGRYNAAAASDGTRLCVAGSGLGNTATASLEVLRPASELVWSTDVSSVATVSASGLATAVAAGTARVIASSGAISGYATLTVPAPTLASIAVTPVSASLQAGATAQFTAAGTFTDGSTRTLTGEVAWTTDVSSVAAVDAGGLATAVAAGTARVIASAGAVSGYATLAVTPPPVTLASIAVTPAAATLLAGATAQFAAVGTFSDGSTRAFASGTGAWLSRTPMNTARTGAAGAFAGGKFFVFGGVALTSTEAYDPLTGAWTARAAQPVNRSYAQAAALDGKIYVVGGAVNADGNAATGALWMYDPAADAWTQKASMPTARFTLSFEAIDGKLYAAGGLVPGYAATSTLEVYDPATDAWQTKTSMPLARGHVAGGVIGGKLYVAGGSPTAADLQIYDPASNSWTPGASQPLARYDQGGAVLDGKLYVMGGQSAAGTAEDGKRTFVYDAAAGSWSEGPLLNVSRYGPTTAVGGGNIFVAGSLFGNLNTTSLEELTPAGEAAWSVDASSVATVTATGLATALSEGAARVTASAGAITGYATLTVTAPPVTLASIAVTPAAASILTGGTAQFAAAGTFSDGSTRTLTGEVAWSTDVSSVATVTASGLATGVGGGTARVIASSGTVTGYANLTVTVPAPTVTSIAPSSAAAGASVTAALTGTGFDASAALSLERSDALRGTWWATGSFTQGRYAGTLTKLRDGRVLLAGGIIGATTVGSADVDLYDPATGSWTAGPPLNQGRNQYAAVRLADGRVLVAGGYGPGTALASVEIYDPALSTWTAAASMASARVWTHLAVLGDGRVLAAGGHDGTSYLSSAEIYDPAADSWSPAAPLGEGTAGATIATLSSGKVLIAGGFGAKATAEVYDPAANAWTSAGSMSVAHYLPEAVVLPGGKVLVTAGSSAGGAEPASVYDPATNAWTATGLMGVQRYVHAMVLVNGTALVVGGENSSTNLASTEIYDAATNAWRPGPGLTAARTWARAVALDDGRVLVAGGQQGGANSNTAELLGAPAAVIAATGVTVTDAQHLSGNVDLTGAATGYWDVVVRESGGRIGRLDAGFRITEPPVPAAPTLTSLAVTPSTASIPAGATAQFAAAGTFTDGSTRTLTGEVVWSTDVSSVATVDASGLATGVGGGTAHVIASSGAITGQAALGVAYVATSTGTVGGSPELTLVSTAPFSVVLVSSQAVEGTIALGSAAAQGITLVSALYDVTRQDPGATATLTWFFDPALVDAAALAIWRFDGISWSSVTVLNQVVSVTDGVGTVTGEVVLTSLFGLFARDVLPPVTALLIDGLASGATSQAIASTSSIGFAAADAGVGVRETLYALDGGAEAVFVSSFSLTAGTHALTYRSVDRAGNQEAARTVAIAVTDPSSDAAPPLVRLDFPGAAALGVESAVGGVVTVRGSAADGSALTWTLSAGLTVLASGTGNVSGALAAWDTSALTGPQTLTLSATDAYGNAASTSAQVFVGAPAMTFAVGRKDSDAIVSTLKGPTGIAVRSDGAVWVASTENDKILLISAEGVLLGAAGQAPGHSGEDREHGKKEKKDKEDEEHGRGSSAGLSFKSPQGLALDAADHLYVADRDLNRVLKLSSDGQVLLLKLGEPGSGPGKLKRPFDAAVDVNGDIYVADSGSRRIAVFDASGVFLRQFGQGALPAESEVRGIALTSEGLWVSDKESERIYLFSRAGGLIKSIGGADSVVGEISRTRGLAADRLGALYVVEPNRDRAQKFDPQGKGLLAFGSKAGLSRADKLAKRYLTQPFDAALAPDGSIWLTDTGRDRIVRYALPVSDGYGVAAYSAGGGAASSASLEPARRVVDHADGATVSRDDGAGVRVPKGALTADLEITVDEGDENLDKEQKTAKRREMKIKAASGEVQYGPEGTTFNAPVTLILPYDADLIASQGIREDDLKVYYWNPTLKDWQAMPSTVDKQNKTVSAQTTHFSVYQAGGPSGGVGVAAVIDEFGLRDQYAFPNPSRNGASVTFRIQPGLADSIEVRVYDVSGRKVHSSSDFRFSVLDDGNGKGAQNTYDHSWNVSGVGSGIYTYVIKAGRAGQTPIVKTGKAGVIK